MALNFPDPATQTPVNTWSPTSTPSASTNGLTYLWDGAKWTTEGGVPNLHWTRAGSVLSPTNAGDDVQIASLNSGPLAGFRNQIINGNLSVNQRNAVNTTLSVQSSQFATDRWQLQSGDGLPISCVIRPGNFAGGASAYLDISSTAQTVFIKQLVELPGVGSQGAFQSNSSWTVSWWGANVEFAGCHFSTGTSGTNGANWTASAPFQVETSGTAIRQAVNITVSESIGASDTCVEVVWKVTTPNTVASFYSAQLEPGSVATPFEYRPIGTELALCQRYYQSLFTSVEQVAAHSTSGRDFIFPIQTVSMRPNVTFANGPAFVVLNSDSASTSNFRQYGMGAPETDALGTIYMKGNFAPAASGGTPDAMAAWQTSSEFNADAEL